MIPKEQTLQVLLVEDDPGDARLIREMLCGQPSGAWNQPCELQWVQRVASVQEVLAAHPVDVILLDLSLPDSEAVQTVARVRAQTPRVPIIVLTGRDDAAAAVQAIKAGAQDYLVKCPAGDVLIRSIRYAVEQARLEQRLRLTEYRLRRVADGTQDILIVYNLEQVPLYTNPAFAAKTGYSAQELAKSGLASLVRADDRAAAQQLMQRAGSGEAPPDKDLRIVTKDGPVKWFSASCAPARDEDGTQIGVTLRATDITARREAEDTLARERSLLRTVIDATPDGIYVKDTEGRFVLANTAVAQAMGVSNPEHLLGKRDADYYPPELAAQYAADEQRIIATGEPMVNKEETYIDQRTGVEEWSLTTKVPVRDALGRITGIVGTGRKISARRRAEKALRRSEARLALAQSIAHIGSFTFDLGTGELNCTEETYHILGLQPQEVTPSPEALFRYVHADDRTKLEAAATDVQNATGQADLHVRVIRPDGQERIVRTQLTPHTYEAGHPPLLIGTIQDVTEGKKAEMDLQAAKDFAENLIATANTIILGLDRQGCVTLFNKAAEHVTGYAAAEIMGCNWADVMLPPDVRPSLQREFQRILVGEALHNYENPIRCKSGEQRYIAWQNNVVRQNGIITGTISFGIDITERKRADEALRASEATLRAFINALPDPAFLLDRDKIVLMGNHALAHGLGMAEDDLVGKSMFAVLRPEIAEARAAYLDQALQTGQIVTFEDARAGRHYMNRIYPIPGATPDSTKLAVLALDITEQKQTEEALRASEQLYRTLVDALPEGVAVSDVSGNTMFASPPMATIYSSDSPEEAIGSNGLTWIAPECRERALADMQTLLSGKAPPVGEYVLLKKDGSRFCGEIRAALLTDPAGKPLGFVSVHRDVTERKEAEKKLEESEKRYRALFENAALGIFQTTLDGKPIAVNPAFAHMMGYQSPADYQATVRDVATGLFADPKRRLELTRQLPDSPNGQITDNVYRRKDGSTILGRVHVRLVTSYNGYEPFIEGFVEDITEQKRTQEALQVSMEERRHAMAQLEAAYERLRITIQSSIDAIALTVEARDPYTAGHQARVASLAGAIARQMQLSDDQIEGIRTAASIHDLGKIRIPTEILSKPGLLNDLEMGLIRTHPRVGYDLLKGIQFTWPIAQMVLQHHERMNGTGYPAGLKGEQILLEARILAVADVVDAMTLDRPYRPSPGILRALDEMRLQRGILYDAAAVDACLRVFEGGYAFPLAGDTIHVHRDARGGA